MLSLKNIKLIVVCISLAIVTLSVSLAYFAWPNIRFYREFGIAQSLIDKLESKRPPEIKEESWRVATGWANNAFGNICFSPSHVTFQELRKFRIDLEGHTSGQVDLSTIDWIWKRLAKTGSAGNEYRNKYRHMYLSEFYKTTSYEALSKSSTFEARVDDLILWKEINDVELWIYVTTSRNERIMIEITTDHNSSSDIASHVEVGCTYKFPDLFHKYLSTGSVPTNKH